MKKTTHAVDQSSTFFKGRLHTRCGRPVRNDVQVSNDLRDVTCRACARTYGQVATADGSKVKN